MQFSRNAGRFSKEARRTVSCTRGPLTKGSAVLLASDYNARHALQKGNNFSISIQCASLPEIDPSHSLQRKRQDHHADPGNILGPPLRNAHLYDQFGTTGCSITNRPIKMSMPRRRSSLVCLPPRAPDVRRASRFAQLGRHREWAPRLHEDDAERGGGPSLGDYLGLPINAPPACAPIAGTPPAHHPENQCRPFAMFIRPAQLAHPHLEGSRRAHSAGHRLHMLLFVDDAGALSSTWDSARIRPPTAATPAGSPPRKWKATC